MMKVEEKLYADLYADQRDFLWGYAYRLTGDAAEAEDVVQETFVRAMERPPADTTRPWRPWLIRVATNLVRDGARRAKRREYVGPWLPSPAAPSDTAAQPAESPSREPDAAGRYELLESASIAFLLALEALSPRQRAVLLLRDVYEYTVAETSESLEMSSSSVKTTLHRARRALAEYDARRIAPDPRRVRRTGEVLERLLQCLVLQDTAGVEALLADDVCSRSDGNGRFYAARVPVYGRERVAKLYCKIAELFADAARKSSADPADPMRVGTEILNGAPTWIVRRPGAGDGFAEHLTMSIELDENDQIRAIYTTLAPEKLTAVPDAVAAAPRAAVVGTD